MESTSTHQDKKRNQEKELGRFLCSILPVLLLQMVMGFNFSSLVILFPQEAQLKGIFTGQTEPSIVTLGVFTSFYGYMKVLGITKIEKKVMLRGLLPGSLLVSGVSSIFFGLLQWLNHSVLFLILAYYLIAVQAEAFGLEFSSLLFLLGNEFPTKIATIKALCDASFLFGLAVGPVFGRFLYVVTAGMFLPFCSNGLLLLFNGAIVVAVLQGNIEINEIQKEQLPMKWNRRVFLGLSSCLVTSLICGCLTTILPSLLASNNLSAYYITEATHTFILAAFLTMVIIGSIIDTFNCSHIFWFIGVLLLLLGLGISIVVSPHHMGYFKTFLSSLFLGTGIATTLVANFSILHQTDDTVEGPDHSTVTCLFVSTSSVGYATGVFISGRIIGAIGLSWDILSYFILLQMTLLLLLAFTGCCVPITCRKKGNAELEYCGEDCGGGKPGFYSARFVPSNLGRYPSLCSLVNTLPQIPSSPAPNVQSLSNNCLLAPPMVSRYSATSRSSSPGSSISRSPAKNETKKITTPSNGIEIREGLYSVRLGGVLGVTFTSEPTLENSTRKLDMLDSDVNSSTL